MTRLTARFWVDAYLARLRLQDIPGFVVAHGDDTAGSVLVKLNTLDGQAVLYQRSYDILADRRAWTVLAEGEEPVVDAAIARQRFGSSRWKTGRGGICWMPTGCREGMA
jgi:hypothetical protein